MRTHIYIYYCLCKTFIVINHTFHSTAVSKKEEKKMMRLIEKERLIDWFFRRKSGRGETEKSKAKEQYIK